MTIFKAAAPLRAMSRKTDFPFFSGAANEKGLLPMATSRLPGMAMLGSVLLMAMPSSPCCAARLA